ncbi:MAG: hypothetical protein DSY90_10825 [Deltaproteobacteria bacterium]|nr:MAG: hypothetical protein DSY90_10825 [Deltaproteobacteria bacterium]
MENHYGARPEGPRNRVQPSVQDARGVFLFGRLRCLHVGINHEEKGGKWIWFKKRSKDVESGERKLYFILIMLNYI